MTSDANQARLKQYAGDPKKERSLLILILILAPIAALVVWAALFDLRQRRRRASLTGHDIAAETRMARADREGRISGTGGGFGR